MSLGLDSKGTAMSNCFGSEMHYTVLQSCEFDVFKCHIFSERINAEEKCSIGIGFCGLKDTYTSTDLAEKTLRFMCLLNFNNHCM